jgi:hypothetical protein
MDEVGYRRYLLENRKKELRGFPSQFRMQLVKRQGRRTR